MFAPKNVILAAAAVALVVLIAVYVPVFWTGRNISSVLVSTSTIGLLAVGVSFTLAGKGLDISLPAVMALSAVCGAKVMVNTQNLFVGILTMFAVAVLFGIVNGVACSVFKMYPFIVTMSTMILVKGINLTLTNGIYYYPSDYLANAMTFKIGGLVPVMIIVTLGLLVVFQFIKKYTKFGRNLIAVGCNKLNAAKMGINVDRNLVITFVISGVCAAFAGIISVTNVLTVTPATGDGFEFTATAMVLLGGTSLSGGKGSFVPGSIFGVLFLLMIQNGLSIMGVNPYYMPIIRGLCIFLAMFSDSIKSMIGKR